MVSASQRPSGARRPRTGRRPEEQAACQPYLVRELELLPDVRVLVALGAIGWEAALRTLAARGVEVPRPRPRFAHGAEVDSSATYTLVGTYHPSQQNTFTGKLTQPMLQAVLERAKALAAIPDSSASATSAGCSTWAGRGSTAGVSSVDISIGDGERMGELQAPSAALVDERPTVSTGAFLAIIRDIARGGLAGLIVGFVGAGLGSRLAMRIAALLVPQANGLLTENGFRIEADHARWDDRPRAVRRPRRDAVPRRDLGRHRARLPRRLAPRALVAVPIAIAFGAGALIDARNPDFSVLRRDPLVVATLVTLIAALGPAMALADAWLDRVLPRPTAGSSGAAMGYAALTAIGALLGVALGAPGDGRSARPPVRADDARHRRMHPRVVGAADAWADSPGTDAPAGGGRHPHRGHRRGAGDGRPGHRSRARALTAAWRQPRAGHGSRCRGAP